MKKEELINKLMSLLGFTKMQAMEYIETYGEEEAIKLIEEEQSYV